MILTIVLAMSVVSKLMSIYKWKRKFHRNLSSWAKSLCPIWILTCLNLNHEFVYELQYLGEGDLFHGFLDFIQKFGMVRSTWVSSCQINK